MKNKNYLITGSAGFIGFHLSKKLLSEGFNVLGVDNLNNYYDQKIKQDRNNILKKYKNYRFNKIDIKDYKKLDRIFKKNSIHGVVNLAAQAGVRYSLKNPRSYIENNINGFFNILELSKKYRVKKFIYASTSSIYGLQKKFPLKENFNTDNPIQLYAATKKSNELMATSYSHLYKMDTIGLRFFTVYGPWGRPDMALFKFTKNIIKGKPIEVFNKGKHERDFTYVDDIVNGIFNIINNKKSRFGAKIFNIGNGKKIKLLKYIQLIEKNLDRKSKKKFLPLQKGDVIPDTKSCGGKFIEWYVSYR